MKFLFLKLFKARQNMQKKASTLDNCRNFGLFVKVVREENIAPVIKFSGTFEEFSRMVDEEIFQGSMPRNVLEKIAQKSFIEDTIWFLVDLQPEKFIKVVEFLFLRSEGLKKTSQDSIEELKKSNSEKNKNIDELRSKLNQLELNSAKQSFKIPNVIFSEDSVLKNQETEKVSKGVGTKVNALQFFFI